MVASIDNSGSETVVTCLDEARHGLEDGDCVTFSEVRVCAVCRASHACARRRPRWRWRSQR